MSNFQLLKLGIWFLIWLSVLGIGIFFLGENTTKIQKDYYGIPLIQGNTLIGVSPINFPHTMVYGSLISCLITHESSGNPRAYNPRDTDGREKFGCLQFGDIEFQDFCVERYELRNDIYDCDVQKVCADKMIAEGYARKWGTLSRCIE